MINVETRAEALEDETRRWVIRALALLRAAQTLPWLAVFASSHGGTYRTVAVVPALYGAYMCWAVVLFTIGIKRDGLTPRWVAADVIVAAWCTIVVGVECQLGAAVTWQNWTVGPLMGASIVAAVYTRRSFAVSAAAILALSYVIGVHADLAEQGSVGTIAGNVASGAAFTIAAALVVSRYLKLAVQADNSAADALEARETEARMAERVRQYDLLHTNVLQTLIAIARGPDLLTPQIRALCLRDIKYLKNIVRSVVDANPSGLNARLVEAISDLGALDMEIHYDMDDVPADVPANVVDAVTLAVREALNNVFKYAGTKEAWVTATGEPGGSLSVTVTDQGRGFDQHSVERGLGLSRILDAGITQVGGKTRITSRPGLGTRVQIEWAR